MRAELVTPTQLSSDPAAVHILVDALTGADLGFPDAGFADPAPALRGGRQLQFLHLRGVRKSPQSQPASLPDAPLTALAATTAPMAFLLSSNGREASIAVGTAAPHDRQLLTSLQALLGGPPPAPISVDHLLRDWQSTGCLVGLPETPSPRPEGTRLSTSPADLLLDTLHGTPFLWVILATPEPTARVEAQIAHARSLVEEIERTHLQLGEQANIDRAALKAKALLDRNPRPTRDDIYCALDVHICRCGSHNRVIRAIQRAAQEIAP